MALWGLHEKLFLFFQKQKKTYAVQFLVILSVFSKQESLVNDTF